MSPSHSSLSEHDLHHHVPPFPVLPHRPSLLQPSRDEPNTTESTESTDCLVVWPYKVRSQVYEPNAIVKIRSTEVYSYSPSVKEDKFFCSVYNFGEDATFAPVSSEVDERQSIGRAASPLHLQKREASAIPARITLQETVRCHAHHTFQARRNTHANRNRAET